MKIASIERLNSVEPHPNADRLDVVKVLGFQCVTAKGLYHTGDIVVYIQPDSILPEQDWAKDYRKYSPTRIKACKIRNEWSEGIIVPLDILPVVEQYVQDNLNSDDLIGTDIASMIEVEHYEPPAPQDLTAKGKLPFGIPKTDEDRWENRVTFPYGELVDITLKIDGQSCSYYYKLDTDEFGVLGRSLEYYPDTQNRYTAHVERLDLHNKLKKYCIKHNVSICLRGESYGVGIQNNFNNPHASKDAGILFFSVYLIDERRYARKGDPHYFTHVCGELDLPIVPTLIDQVLTPEMIQHYSIDIDQLDGNPFEGVVIQHSDFKSRYQIDTGESGIIDIDSICHAGSFKIINKAYDSKK